MLNCDTELVCNTKKSLNVKKKILINVRFLKSESGDRFDVEIKREKARRRLTFFDDYDR